jgi:hypothetical protein
MSSWKDAGKKALGDQFRGDANEIAIRSILEALSEEQIEEFLQDGNVQ